MPEHKEWVKNVFDRAAPSYGEKGCSFFEYFGERLNVLAGPVAGEKILDIATGKGAVLFPAAKDVGPQGSAIGIDISLRMIQEAQKRTFFSWVELRQMDAEHLLFDDHSFDVVFCAFALFFSPNSLQALSECKKVLKPNGRLAVSTFGKKSSFELWISERIKELGVAKVLGTISLDSSHALRKLLERAGFSQIEIHEESKIFWHENAEAWWNSLWSHGIRSRLELLSSKDLEKLKKEALLKAGMGKVSEERQVFYAVAKLLLQVVSPLISSFRYLLPARQQIAV